MTVLNPTFEEVQVETYLIHFYRDNLWQRTMPAPLSRVAATAYAETYNRIRGNTDPRAIVGRGILAAELSGR